MVQKLGLVTAVHQSPSLQKPISQYLVLLKGKKNTISYFFLVQILAKLSLNILYRHYLCLNDFQHNICLCFKNCSISFHLYPVIFFKATGSSIFLWPLLVVSANLTGQSVKMSLASQLRLKSHYC